MAMYEFLIESDVIQTPDDVEAPLDEIEAAVQEDLEKRLEEAETGDLNPSEDVDPVEEASMIVYESAYNFNQLMRCIGINELHEAASGREFILEAVDIKGFFEKVKNILTNMFRAITKAFKNVLNRLVTAFTSDKKLATDHAAAIRAGYKSEWTFKGYKFSEEAIQYKCESMLDRMSTGCKKALDIVKSGRVADVAMGEYTGHKVIIERNTGIRNVEDLADLREALQKKYFGSDSKVKFGKDGEKYPGEVEGVINLLKADKETKAIKEGYNKIKNDYKKALEAVKKYEKEITAADYTDSNKIGAAFKVCSEFNQAIIFEKNVQNTVYSYCMKAAKAKRAQARRLALMWQRAGTKKNLDDKYPKVQHNSASLFGNIDLI